MHRAFSIFRRQWPLLVILFVYLVAGSLYATSAPLLDVSDEVRHYAMIEQLVQGKGLPIQDPVRNRDITRQEQTEHIPLLYYAQEGSQPPLYYALMAVVALPFNRGDWPAHVQPNPHALLGRADATSNWNQLLHTPDEFAPLENTALVVMTIRFIGVLLGAVTVVCAYLIALELTGDHGSQITDWGLKVPVGLQARSPISPISQIANLAAALVAFNPMFVHIMASVNNDTLAAALSSLALLLGVRMIRHGVTVRGGVWLGCVLGGAALSKASGVALAVAVPIFVLISLAFATRDKAQGEEKALASSLSQSSVSSLVSLAAAMLLPVLIIAGWWYVRNVALYGDPTGTAMMATIAGARDPVPTVLDLLGEWDGFFKAYWGLFGAVNIPMPAPIYSALEALMALASGGLMWVVGRWLFEVGREIRDKGLLAPDVPDAKVQSPIAYLSSPTSLILFMLATAFLIAFVALVRWTSLTLASQGRLLFPVIVPISIFTAIGLLNLVARLAARITTGIKIDGVWLTAVIVAVVPVLLAALTLAAPFVYIKPAYQVPTLLASAALLPSDITPTELYFEDKIRWIGYRVDTPQQRVHPGETLDVTLYWQSLKPLDKNYSAFIRLYGRDAMTVTLLDTYPGGGMWQTTLWHPNDIVADHYRLRVADTQTNTRLMPTALNLDVGFWDYKAQHFLDTLDTSGTPTGRQQYPAASLNELVPGSASLFGTSDASHFDKASVRNVVVAEGNHSVTLKLDWWVTGDVMGDYTTFVQLFDYTGKQMPESGDKPASFAPRWWRKGDVIVGDTYTVPLPPNFPAGQYTLKFGLYNKEGVRMLAFDAKKQPITDAAISMPISIK